jgi:acyl-CoA thioesterase-1
MTSPLSPALSAVVALVAVATLLLPGPGQAQAPGAPMAAAAIPASPAEAAAGPPALRDHAAASPAVNAPAGATPAIAARPETRAAKTTPCDAPANLARLDLPLSRLARRLTAGEPIKIVAIGSSSTAGAGASSPAASYPSRLAAELKQRLPGRDITVVNRGVNGEEAAEMLARFATEVLPDKPDLVLWQVGTNSVLRNHPVAPAGALIQHGVDQLKATGADVLLIDPQFAPKVIAKADAPAMIDLIARAAKHANVHLFRRYALMRYWREVEGVPFDTFVSPDELHMNDWGYACVAKVLAGAITEAATRATALAHTAPSAAASSGR